MADSSSSASVHDIAKSETYRTHFARRSDGYSVHYSIIDHPDCNDREKSFPKLSDCSIYVRKALYVPICMRGLVTLNHPTVNHATVNHRQIITGLWNHRPITNVIGHVSTQLDPGVLMALPKKHTLKRTLQ